MRRVWLATVFTLILAGCGQGMPGSGASSDEAVAVEMVEPIPEAAPPAVAPSTPATPTAAAPVTTPRIAYVYRYGLEVPVQRITPLMAQHEEACTSAGAAVCQVIGSSSNQYGQDQREARLEIRATPAFITRFRTGLQNDASEAGGRITEAVTESQDLTRSMIDTEARLRAQTTLRDRLQSLLATRSGSLEDLLKVETALARVQGEIDAQQSMLAEMQTRVATSALSVQYTSAGQLAPDSAFTPVVRAVQGALGAMMATLGVMITVIAILIPIGLIAVPLGWFVLKRRRARKVTPPPAS